jgi:hypothetical protein
VGFYRFLRDSGLAFAAKMAENAAALPGIVRVSLAVRDCGVV